MRQHTNWSKFLDSFGRRLLEYLNVDPDNLPDDYNPVTRELKSNSNFVNEIKGMPGFSRAAMCRLVIICQMVTFDRRGGPEGDGKPKALRRHWYQYFKTDFAQPFAQQIGDVQRNAQGVLEIDDLAWTQRLSQTYGDMVDSGYVTYRELWVEDASRMMKMLYDSLFRNCNILIAVEKDSLFQDFVAPAQALGAKAVYSGKGKSSKAAIEKLLRDIWGWSSEYNPFTEQSPLIILHVSDYDFDGHAVIGPTFGEQSRRYTKNIYEARIGINPAQVIDAGHNIPDKWYQVKLVNKGYQEWAEQNAVFTAECADCGNAWCSVGIDETCPDCGGDSTGIDVSSDIAHGFEVEALSTRYYYGLLVDALLTVLPFDFIVSRLREECIANSYTAVDRLVAGILASNEDYQGLLKEFDRLNKIKEDFEGSISSQLHEVADDHVSDFEDEEDDPEPEDFKEYVADAASYSGPWRPFSEEVRTEKLVEWVTDENQDLIDDLTNQSIEW